MYRNTHQDIEFVKFTKENIYDTIKIDLNYDLMWGEYLGKRIDISSFVKEDNSELDIYGVKAVSYTHLLNLLDRTIAKTVYMAK